MKYLIGAVSVTLMLTLVGCGSNSGSLTGRINNVMDSVGTDGNGNNSINGANGANGTNGMNGRNNTVNGGYYADGYYGDTSSSYYYSNNAIESDSDSMGYRDLNGSSIYDNNYNNSNSLYSTDTNENTSPYGFGMPGAENILGNDNGNNR